MIDTETRQVLTAADRPLPARAAGMTVEAFLATQPRLEEFWTPLLVLDDAALQHNIDTLAAWAAQRGLVLMPHGKTSMAPTLWQRQIDAGALGITLATMGQVRVARAAGLSSIQIANTVTDPQALAYLAGELTDPTFRVLCWVDSVESVALMEAALVDAPRRVDVLVELGAAGGRTGARSTEEAERVAERVAASPVLRLAGVAGYEGALAHGGRSAEEVDAVTTYLHQLTDLHALLEPLYEHGGDLYVSAGGSTYFDLVADAFTAAGARWGGPFRAGGGQTHFVLRSGAYVTHDDGFYRRVSPFDESRPSDDEPRFRNAMHGIARVGSRPEPGLSLLDGGKRDFPFDEGLPVVRAVAERLGGPWTTTAALGVSAMNDHHTFVRAVRDGGTPAVGHVVRLGLSHPCTAFDKWRLIPVVDSLESGRVVDLIRTLF